MGHQGLGQRCGGEELRAEGGRAKEQGGRVKRRSLHRPGQFKFHILPEKTKAAEKARSSAGDGTLFSAARLA
jgi:hypothetical protein